MHVPAPFQSGHRELPDPQPLGDLLLAPLERFAELDQGTLGRPVEQPTVVALPHPPEHRRVVV